MILKLQWSGYFLLVSVSRVLLRTYAPTLLNSLTKLLLKPFALRVNEDLRPAEAFETVQVDPRNGGPVEVMKIENAERYSDCF